MVSSSIWRRTVPSALISAGVTWLMRVALRGDRLELAQVGKDGRHARRELGAVDRGQRIDGPPRVCTAVMTACAIS